MEPYADETTSMGAQFWRFRKRSSDVFSTAAADSVRTLIEGGVSLMNFFAHAYSESFDITIDDPSNYNWNGKHPIVIGNSCYIGNIHLNADGASTSEDWVLRPAAGPIAFLAATQIGVDFNLYSYTYRLYESLGTVNYGGSFGKHMRHAAASLLTNQNNWGTVYGAHLHLTG